MKFFRRLWFWMRRRQLETGFEEEVRQHLERKSQAAIEQGMPAQEARRSAHLDFGNPALAKEHSRRSWGFPSLESVLQDLRFAFRQLRKSPGFTLAAILTLALGIGANAAIFSAVYSVLLRPLPFQEAERLLIIRKENIPRSWTRNAISAPEFLAWREQTKTFEAMAAYEHHSCVVKTGDDPEEDPCEIITSNLFSLLRVSPFRGRTFVPDEDRLGGPVAVILSYGLWQRRFSGDDSAVGRKIQLDGKPATVVGVMSPGFTHLYASPYESLPELWVSGIELSPGLRWNNYVGLGRLRAHATPAQAQAEMDAISARLEQAFPDFKGWRAELLTLRDYSSDTRPMLVVLMGAVVFVLLIACANVANLLLARGAGRRGEFAVRTALGASRGRLVRQLMTEGLLISLSGGVLGVLLARLGDRGLAALAPSWLLKSAPGLAGAATNWQVLLFTAAVALATTLMFGMAPALESARLGASQAIKESSRTLLESRRSRRFRDILVASEIALAMVLLAGAGLMLRTLAQLSHVKLGFSPDHTLTLRVPLTGARYKDPKLVVVFWQRVIHDVEALPGVESASVSWGLPLDDWNGLSFTTAEQPNPPAGRVPDADYSVISPEYFRTMKIPLVQGRPFTEQDGQSGQDAAIVNEELARRYWPGQNPLGKRLRMETGDNNGSWLSVIGVVGNVLTRGPDSELLPGIYVPYNQLPWLLAPPKRLVVRTHSTVAPDSVANSVMHAVHQIDSDQPVADLRTMDQISDSTRSSERMILALLGLFAVLALLLSALGIYSVLSYSVAQRTREIGVRMALGAEPGNVQRLMVGNGLGVAAVGIAAGVAAALLLTRLMKTLLFGVGPADPVAFCSVTIILAISSLAACYLPARRAAKVDPMIALRHE